MDLNTKLFVISFYQWQPADKIVWITGGVGDRLAGPDQLIAPRPFAFFSFTFNHFILHECNGVHCYVFVSIGKSIECSPGSLLGFIVRYDRVSFH